MGLLATALLTLEDTKQFLDIKGSQSDAVVEDCINRATMLCELKTGRLLKRRAFGVGASPPYPAVRVAGTASRKLYLPVTPVNPAATITVTLNGESQTVWRVEADGDPDAFDVVLSSTSAFDVRTQYDHLWRSLGWEPLKGSAPTNVVVAFEGGFDPIPDDLREAALLIVHKLFHDQQKNLIEVQTISLPSGSVSLLNTVMPRRAQEILESYRPLRAAVA